MTPALAENIEKAIAACAIQCLLNAGYEITVWPTDDATIRSSTDLDMILACLRTTDEDEIHAALRTDRHEPPAPAGYPEARMYSGMIRLIYGNEPWNVIADSSAHFIDLLKPADQLATAIEEVITQQEIEAQ